MIKIKRSSDGQFYWVLYAKNGEALCTSEMFKQKVKAIKSAGVMLDLVAEGGVEIGDFSADLRLAMYAEEKPDNGIKVTLPDPAKMFKE